MILSKLDKLSNRDKILLAVAVLLLVAALGDNFVVRVVVNELKGLRSSIEAEKKALAYNDTVSLSEDEVIDVFEGLSDKLGRVTTADTDLDIMKGEIDDFARQAGLTLTSMKHREPRKWPHYTEYLVDIGGFEGGEGSLITFLSAVQRSKIPGLMRVTHLAVSAGRKERTIRGSMVLSKVMIPEKSGA